MRRVFGPGLWGVTLCAAVGASRAAAIQDIRTPTPVAETIQVAVVDAEGAPGPPGLRVELEWWVPGLGGGSGPQPLGEGHTDEHGRAILSWAEGRQRLAVLKQAGLTPRFAVRLAVPLEPKVEQVFDELPVDAPEVRLVLSDHGSLAVQVTTPDGGPVPERRSVRFHWRAAEHAGSGARFSGHGRRNDARVVDGVARFPVVPLGMEFELSSFRDSAYEGARTTLLGPTQNGEEREAHLVLGAAMVPLRAVLVDPEDEPLRSEHLIVELVPEGAEPDAEGRIPIWQRWLPRTGADGALAITRIPELPVDRRWELRLIRRARHSADAELRATVPTAARLSAPMDLGQIRMTGEMPRMIAAGRVVGPDDRPVPGASVSVYADGLSLRPSTGSSFRIFAPGEVPAVFGLTANAIGYLPTTIEAARGSEDLVIRLQPAGSLQGRFLLDERVPAYGIRMTLRWESGESTPDGGGVEFGAVNLPPREYTVTARTDQMTWEIARVDEVLVRAGEVTEDPRLQPFDLRGKCRVLRFRCLDEAGDPLPKIQVSLRDPGGGGGFARTDHLGTIQVVAPIAVESLTLEYRFRDEERVGEGRWRAADGDATDVVLRVR